MNLSSAKKQNIYRIENLVFCLCLTALFIVMLIQDGKGANSVAVKYLIVCCCFAQSFVGFRLRRYSLIFSVALLCTCVADLFLLVVDDYYYIGMCFFIVAQASYAFYLYRQNSVGFVNSPFLRLAVAVAAVVGILLSGVADLTAALSAFYFVFLLFNCLLSWVNCGKLPFGIILALGFTLFIGCDICTLLHNFSSYGINLSVSAKNFASYAIWVFYAPSQVLIILSQTLQNSKIAASSADKTFQE